jgi:hypothetical protein
MHERFARIVSGDDNEVAASAVVRIAMCHYMIRSGSPDHFLAELRYTAGLGTSRRRMKRAAAG